MIIQEERIFCYSQSMEDITVLKPSGANPSKQLSVQSIVDCSEKRSCDCDM